MYRDFCLWHSAAAKLFQRRQSVEYSAVDETEFEPVRVESIDRKLIDSVEVSE